MDDQVKWLASLLHGYEHYPETFGEDWPNVLAESLACHLWPDKLSESIFRSGGQTKQFGPRPRIVTNRPSLT